MSNWPWITISNHVVTIGDITDPTYDGESIIFTVIATDPIFDTNDDLVFQVDITAPCLTATINDLAWVNSPNFDAVDGSGQVSETFVENGISYGGMSNYCGSIQFDLVDSLGNAISGSWVSLDLTNPA